MCVVYVLTSDEIEYVSYQITWCRHDTQARPLYNTSATLLQFEGDLFFSSFYLAYEFVKEISNTKSVNESFH